MFESTISYFRTLKMPNRYPASVFAVQSLRCLFQSCTLSTLPTNEGNFDWAEGKHWGGGYVLAQFSPHKIEVEPLSFILHVCNIPLHHLGLTMPTLREPISFCSKDNYLCGSCGQSLGAAKYIGLENGVVVNMW